MCPTPLDAPRRELFIRIFKFVVVLSVSRQINFVCVCTGRPIQLYDQRGRATPIYRNTRHEEKVPEAKKQMQEELQHGIYAIYCHAKSR